LVRKRRSRDRGARVGPVRGPQAADVSGVAELRGLVFLKELIEAGKVTPVIDRAYPMGETPEAIGHVGEGHARGKVAITVPG
jgi:NADPH:quinone reductase-like Zn-dependent oxidoreductase